MSFGEMVERDTGHRTLFDLGRLSAAELEARRDYYLTDADYHYRYRSRLFAMIDAHVAMTCELELARRARLEAE